MFLNFVLVLHELVFVVAAPDVIDKYPLQTNINYINFNVLNCIKFKRREEHAYLSTYLALQLRPLANILLAHSTLEFQPIILSSLLILTIDQPKI